MNDVRAVLDEAALNIEAVINADRRGSVPALEGEEDIPQAELERELAEATEKRAKLVEAVEHDSRRLRTRLGPDNALVRAHRHVLDAIGREHWGYTIQVAEDGSTSVPLPGSSGPSDELVEAFDELLNASARLVGMRSPSR